jgi:hypothetical protein
LEAIGEDFARLVRGRELRSAFLGLALALLALESLLAAPRSARRTLLAAAFLLLPPPGARAQQGDRLTWNALRVGPSWDPYPGVHREILEFLSGVTSVLSSAESRVLTLRDPELFSAPLVVLAGREAPPALDDDELRRLRDFLSSGGMLWVEDVSGVSASSFDAWVRTTLLQALPDASLRPLPAGHVLFKTFFLARRVGGRARVTPFVEGVERDGRLVVVYSRNDLLGAWAKDPLGRFLFDCAPGGETQRMDARKLTVNILMYALTGNYKEDAVHQPFLLEKLRRGGP